ncbi:MAG: sigma factor-like helix-turn-helix DNA-binding protein [Patescibacteria group bacterium]
MPKTAIVTFKPKQVVKNLLLPLSERGKEVIVHRFGLGDSVEKETLEAIGKRHGITRERVRQIERYSIATIKSSKEYQKSSHVFDELHDVIKSLGMVVSEEDLLEYLSKDRSTQNHFHFLLHLGDCFNREKEDGNFKHRWSIDSDLSARIYDSLHKLYQNLSDEELVTEPDMIRRFLEHLGDVSDEYKREEIARRWLSISKKISKNPLGEWGKSSSANINTKGMRDYAFLVLRKKGEPVHFREVAKAIEETFNRKAHVATTHNELIKDPRFVLVGRGLYALKEWGYSGGVVRDVIKKALKEEGPLSAEEIVNRVLKERLVRENTVMVNLQNPRYFRKDENGLFHVVE